MRGRTNEWPYRPRARVGNFFLKFCFEMVLHFRAKVTNAARHWFSGGYSEKTELRVITFMS